MSRKWFTMTPEIRKELNRRAKAERDALTMLNTLLAQERYDDAKAARVILKNARARQEAYADKVFNWHEEGMPSSYAK